jgi:hypothetical protein
MVPALPPAYGQDAMKPRLVRWMEPLKTSMRTCVYCGAPFPTMTATALFCTRTHQMRQWRAIKMLEGTHGWVSGNFVRLKVPA